MVDLKSGGRFSLTQAWSNLHLRNTNGWYEDQPMMVKSSISMEETLMETIGINSDQVTMAKIFSFTILLPNLLKMPNLFLIQQLAEALATWKE